MRVWVATSGTGLALLSVIALGTVSLLPTLRHGFVLLALPPSVVRIATVLCLSGGTGLLTMLVPVGRTLGRDEQRTVAV